MREWEGFFLRRKVGFRLCGAEGAFSCRFLDVFIFIFQESGLLSGRYVPAASILARPTKSGRDFKGLEV